MFFPHLNIYYDWLFQNRFWEMECLDKILTKRKIIKVVINNLVNKIKIKLKFSRIWMFFVLGYIKIHYVNLVCLNKILYASKTHELTYKSYTMVGKSINKKLNLDCV